jgi:hypothetical protein
VSSGAHRGRRCVASRLLGHFDGQRSHTYAEHVMRCPGCGVKPDNDAFKAGYGVARRS